MGIFMMAPKNLLNGLEYLPIDYLKTYSMSYAKSFPEFKMDETSLLHFLGRKFPVLEGGKVLNIATLIDSTGKVASGYGVARNGYTYRKQDFTVGLVCDVFTDLDFRKMGLFKKVSSIAIAREESVGVKFLIGFPIRNEVMPGHLSVGWRYLFDMPIWWALPRFGSIKNVERNFNILSSMFTQVVQKIALLPSETFLQWRFSFLDVSYFLITLPNSSNFAIVRKSKIRGIPLTCIVFMQSSSVSETRTLVRTIRNLSLRLGTLGVVGCWNESYANDLFVESAGLRKSSKVQKVIIRELNNFECPNEEEQYRLSWMDSDTL
jgi:hypothetical protein